MGEVFRALQHRLRDSTWTVVFKSLITVHLMIREGSPDVTLAYLAKHRNMLAVSMFSDGQSTPAAQGLERIAVPRILYEKLLTHAQQPKHRGGIYGIMPTTYQNERERIVTQRSTG